VKTWLLPFKGSFSPASAPWALPAEAEPAGTPLWFPIAEAQTYGPSKLI